MTLNLTTKEGRRALKAQRFLCQLGQAIWLEAAHTILWGPYTKSTADTFAARRHTANAVNRRVEEVEAQIGRALEWNPKHRIVK